MTEYTISPFSMVDTLEKQLLFHFRWLGTGKPPHPDFLLVKRQHLFVHGLVSVTVDKDKLNCLAVKAALCMLHLAWLYTPDTTSQ